MSATPKKSEGNSRKFPSHGRRSGKPYSKTFFEENLFGRMKLASVARHILQGSSVRYEDGVMLPLTAPKAYWIVESLLVSMEKDFEMAKLLQSARKGGAA